MGLYACSVRRLKSEKRKSRNFSASASALAVTLFVVDSLVLFALILLFVGCVVGGSFSLRMIATKRKGANSCVLSECFIWLFKILYNY